MFWYDVLDMIKEWKKLKYCFLFYTVQCYVSNIFNFLALWRWQLGWIAFELPSFCSLNVSWMFSCWRYDFIIQFLDIIIEYYVSTNYMLWKKRVQVTWYKAMVGLFTTLLWVESVNSSFKIQTVKFSSLIFELDGGRAINFLPFGV